MTTRIGLISDVHASPLPLRQALDIFERENVDDIICAGDIAGYYDSVAPTIELLARSGCKAIAGNHDQSYLEKPAREDDQDVRAYLEALPLRLELEIEGLKVLVVHASPPAEQNGGIFVQQAWVLFRSDDDRQALRVFSYSILYIGLLFALLLVDHYLLPA